MNLLCILFGHKPPVYAKTGWWTPGEQYAKVKVGVIDGIGRVHGEVNAPCARCSKEFTVALIHIPQLKPKE